MSVNSDDEHRKGGAQKVRLKRVFFLEVVINCS